MLIKMNKEYSISSNHADFFTLYELENITEAIFDDINLSISSFFNFSLFYSIKDNDKVIETQEIKMINIMQTNTYETLIYNTIKYFFDDIKICINDNSEYIFELMIFIQLIDEK